MADMGTRQASEKWGVPQSTVASWCRKKLIDGVTQDKKGSPYHIPENAEPPIAYKKRLKK